MTADPTHSLLVIEDSDEDFFAFERMVRKADPNHPRIYRCSDGDEALDFLYHRGPYADMATPRPSLILLDLNLPGLDGREILSQIKQDETLKAIPIVIFTTSSNPKDVKTCYQRGSNGYIMKPIDARKLKHTLERFIEYWFELSALPDCYL